MTLDAQTTALVEGGSALIVGTVDERGMPRAARGWGLDVLSPRDDAELVCTVRLLLDAHDEMTLANLVAGRAIAVTAADVPTLRSVQLKGISLGVAPGGPADLERMRGFAEAFYADIEATDGTPREILERLTPDELVVVHVEVAEVFDQTPGPEAGRCLPAADGASGGEVEAGGP